MGCKDIGIRKSEFVTKTKFLWENPFLRFKGKYLVGKQTSVIQISIKLFNKMRRMFPEQHFNGLSLLEPNFLKLFYFVKNRLTL